MAEKKYSYSIFTPANFIFVFVKALVNEKIDIVDEVGENSAD